MKTTTREGYIVEVREAVIGDAKDLIEYMSIVNYESKNLAREPHEFTMTVADEEAFLKTTQESNNSCLIVCLKDGLIISSASFMGSGLMRLNHKVSIGISVLLEYQNQGIGSLMMNELIKVAKSYHKTKIELEVRSDNIAAINVYEKCGFKIEGYRTDGFFVDDRFYGLTLMGLNLREKL